MYSEKSQNMTTPNYLLTHCNVRQSKQIDFEKINAFPNINIEQLTLPKRNIFTIRRIRYAQNVCSINKMTSMKLKK